MFHDSSFTVVLFNTKTGQYKVFVQLESKYFRAFIDEYELSIKPVLSFIICSAGLLTKNKCYSSTKILCQYLHTGIN